MTIATHIDDEGFTVARATTPASGGKLLRRYRRNEDGSRDLHRKRRHGAPGTTGGLMMRPPGSGAVDYQSARELVVHADGVDSMAELLASGPVDATPPNPFGVL